MDMDEFVLTERKTYTLELPKVEYPNNINVYYLRMDGNSLKQIGIQLKQMMKTRIMCFC